MSLAAGERVSLIGSNGAGKTTFVNMITGYLKPDTGSIELDGRDITALAPHRRAAAGIGWVPQERNIFKSLTVEENILVPVWVNKSLNEAERLALVYRVLPELHEMRSRRGSPFESPEIRQRPARC